MRRNSDAASSDFGMNCIAHVPSCMTWRRLRTSLADTRSAFHRTRNQVGCFVWINVIVISSVLAAAANGLDTDDYYRDENNSRGLFPPTFNLASTAVITANATCGVSVPETFCKLVEHVREPQCGTCDIKSSNVSLRHPITNAIDGTHSWWQSPSLQNGRKYEWVTITLDLRQVYQVAYVIVKAANSPRPGNWILERSIDGLTYKPWQYYGMSNTDCYEFFGIAPTIGIPRYRSDDEVICTSLYSRLEPLENGEIHTSLVKGRPGVTGPSDKLQEFTAARFVQLRFQKLRTLNADLMTVASGNWERVHRSVTRRYYYSIKDISIGGQCMCFGHAADCPPDPAAGHLKCRCVHNTCGNSCERCCPLYNQKPWRLGTSQDAYVCEKCQCHGHANECQYDKGVANRKESLDISGNYEGGGVCVNCRDFTTGNNCERCIDGYYRPLGVLPDAAQPCIRCVCEGNGTKGPCIRDESMVHQGLNPGDCICREGFAGPRCSQCAVGYRNFPVCDLCPCNFAGTVNTDCEGECVCKPNVDGIRCDRCKPGYFSLDDKNPLGCIKCHCFGITNRCVSANLAVQVIAPRLGWQVSDILGQRVVRPTTEEEALTVDNDDMRAEAYYWLAPDNFTGNKLSTYGGNIHYNISWVRARGDSAGKPVQGPIIVMDGGGMLIAYEEALQLSRNSVAGVVRMSETGWYHMAVPDSASPAKKNSNWKKDRGPVTRQQFMEVLLSLDRLLIQAKFRTDQIVGKFYTVSMEIGSEQVLSVNRLNDVEKCACPIGYAGLSCESCERGYRRVNDTAFKGECRKCDCNNHVDSCDPYTGECQECLYNTTGARCESCRDGFFGVATRGTPTDCRPCACPVEDPRGNLSPTCATIDDGDGGRVDYECTACPPENAGSKCERCANGYFGNPLVPGNFCQLCQCHGHVDLTSPEMCNSKTGECLNCTGNTAGWHCDVCLDGHFGDPLETECEACKCNKYGAINPNSCDKLTGGCVCKPKYIGLYCDQCISGYGNVETGCELCNCNLIGSESSVCDSASGQCSCKPGVFGTKCDTCRDGYYDFSASGCQWCNCNPEGSTNTSCHIDTGQCICLNNVKGKYCDECKEGFWNMSPDNGGCIDCNCNLTGSLDKICHQSTGQCDCNKGVIGKTCDQCMVGHYGYSDTGCDECDQCNSPGHICHPQTGECVCPPHTTGRFCEECEDNAWGYHKLEGCKSCNCTKDGADDQQCDSDTGRCSCREGFEGEQCNKCRFGYFDFPKCKKCKCDQKGTEVTKCLEDGTCECREDGQCPCKINVEGKKCRRCKPGTFGLSDIHQDGCLNCFCFGKSTVCEQPKYAWTQLASPDTLETLAEKTTSSLDIVNGLMVIPDESANADVRVPAPLDTPLYWSLPDMFKGDKVLSYNGRLTFTIKTEGGYLHPVLPTYPLVQLRGNFRLLLEYYPEIISPDGRYEVPLHEDFWKIKNNHESKVTRNTLMVALQNIQHILVRTSEKQDFISSRLENVSIDVATPAPSSPVVAIGIEVCECPPQYNGTSCQDPSDGFYRKRKKDFLNSKDILDLVGTAEPCSCNNRSKNCDKETGVCFNCQSNTSGPHCELCAFGFYGDPSAGSCLPCACPTVDNNYSDTCAVDPFGSLMCTNCKEGYIGQRCEKCDEGYYGDPLLLGNSCKACACDLRGSVGNICDLLSGQCICLDGMNGRDCSQCSYRQVLTDSGCQSCDDECTGLLLDDLDNMTRLAVSVNISGVDPAPWAELHAIDNRAALLQNQVTSHVDAIQLGNVLIHDFDATFNLKGLANSLYLKTKELDKNATVVKELATDRKNIAQSFLKEVLLLQKRINNTITRLKDYARGVTGASLTISAALAEAESKLAEIRDRDFSKISEEVDREKKKAVALLERIKQLIFSPATMTSLTDRMNNLSSILNELLPILSKTEMDVNSANLLNENNRNRLNVFKELLSQVNVTGVNFSLSKSEGGDYLNDAREYLDMAVDNFEEFKSLIDELYDEIYRLDSFVAKMTRLLPEYNTKYVIKAKKHADELMKKAMRLSELFNLTRNDSSQAMKAMNAYKDIANSLNGAFQVATEANEKAAQALKLVCPTSFCLREQAEESKVFSEKKRIEIMNKEEDLDEFDKKLKKIKIRIQNITDINQNVKGGLSSLKKELDDLESKNAKIKANVTKVQGIVNGSQAKTDYTVKKMNDINQRIERELKPKFQSLEVVSSEGVDNLRKNITESLAVIRSLEDKKINIGKTNDRVNSMWKNINDTLHKVEQQVLLARQKASSITISLNGNNGQCNRLLRHDVKPSATNNIVLKFSICTEFENSLLFYLGSNTLEGKARDFVALEIVNRRVRFLWNAGNDTAVVEHPVVLQTNDDYYKYDARWYLIEANRVGNIGTLSVSNFSSSASGIKPIPEENTSSPAFSQINFDGTAKMYIGGLPPKPPLELKSKEFHGCMYDLRLDGEKVSFWNFLSTQTCDGCKTGPADRIAKSADNYFTFNGNGYAKHSTRNMRITDNRVSLIINFKTLDEDVLLFFINKDTSKGYASITLEGGRVVFKFKSDSASQVVRIETDRKYNNGNWTKIQATKEGTVGQLTVSLVNENKTSSHDEYVDSKEGTMEAGSNAGLNLKNADYYLGGVPPGFPKHEWNNTFAPLLGCLRVQLMISLINIKSGQTFGVDDGCVDKKVNHFSSSGHGYIEINGRPLETESGLSFTFQTLSPNGLLLLSTFAHQSTPSKKDFYSLSLKNGRLHLLVGGDGIYPWNETFTINSTHKAAINESYYVYVGRKKKGNVLELRVNDQLISQRNLPNAKSVDSPKNRGMFFAGVPDYLKETVMMQAASLDHFAGIIRDVAFNNKLVDFSHNVGYENVRLNRLDVLPIKVERNAPPMKKPLMECSHHQFVTEGNAVKFGDLPDSYIEVDLLKLLSRQSFNISFEFRSFYQSGLLFAIKRKTNTQNYMAMYLYGGQVQLVFTGKRDRTITQKDGFNDGQWHSVNLMKRKRKITLKLDRKKGNSTDFKGNLNLTNTMLLGGFPDVPRYSQLQSLRNESFKGCIKRFTINQMSIDLAGPKVTSRNVRQCFSRVELGSYFGGDAYAVYSDRFTVGKSMSFELEFRTTKMSGILISVSSPGRSPALALELHEGQVLMSVDQGDRKIFQHSISFNNSKYYVCDNRWHSVKAEYSGNYISLKVDKLDPETRLDNISKLASVDTADPLYVGGIPGSSQIGALKSGENFHGCIRNLEINGGGSGLHKRRDWTDMYQLNNVLLNSCPVS